MQLQNNQRFVGGYKKRVEDSIKAMSQGLFPKFSQLNLKELDLGCNLKK